MESLLVQEEVMSRQTRITAERAITFGQTVGSRSKCLQEFPEAVFLLGPMESLLVEEEVLLRQTGITAENGHNFWSGCWIALKFLQ